MPQAKQRKKLKASFAPAMLLRHLCFDWVHKQKEGGQMGKANAWLCQAGKREELKLTCRWHQL